MSFFHRKKEVEEKPNNYTEWEKDLGFLNLIMSRKKGITKEFLIGVYAKQKNDKDYLTDEEIEPIVERTVSETISQISENYKAFLIKKYFGSDENLIKFISEDIYVDLISDSIKRNYSKIASNLQKKMISNLNEIANSIKT